MSRHIVGRAVCGPISRLRSSRFILVAVLLGLIASAAASAYAGDVKYVYDELGRLVQAIDVPTGNSATYHYDAVGNLLSITMDTPGGSGGSSSASISEISPDAGPIGTTVTINGAGFSPTVSLNSVSFNGTAATVTSATANQLIATVPTGATTGSVSVTAPNGSATSSEPFTVTTASSGPVITSFAPTVGSAGAAVTVSGTNFQTNAADDVVDFNGQAAVISSASSTNLGTTVPAATGSGPITVTTQFGSAVSSSDFFVLPPGITSSSVGYTGQTSIGANAMTVGLGSANQVAVLDFPGTEGQAISLQFTNSTYGCCPTVKIYDPIGGVLYSNVMNGTTWFIDTLTLPRTGTYSITISSSNAGSVNVSVFSATASAGTISVGGPPVVVTASVPGQDGYLVFSGTAGQQISLNWFNSTLDCPTVSILKPDGSTLASNNWCGSSSFIDVQTLPTTGSYTIFIDTNDRAGSISIQLNDATQINGSITPGGSTVTENLNAGQDAYLTFSGTAGQQVSLSWFNSTLDCPTVSILKPDGSTLTSSLWCGSSSFIDTQTLPTAGTYTVFIDTNDRAGAISVNLYNVVNNIASLSIGGPSVNFTDSTPGENPTFTFNGAAGQVVTLALTNATYPCCNNSLEIHNPDGSLLASNTWSSGGTSVNGAALLTTGTYTAVVNPNGANTGNGTLQLYNLSDISGSVNTSDSYAQTVLADRPLAYWRLDEATGTTAADAVPTMKVGVSGPTNPDTAINLSGSTGYIMTTSSYSSPTEYSFELWFQTSTTSGGKLIGFGNQRSGLSSSYDRQLYMTNSGQLVLGQYTGSVVSVTSPSAYNDANWHQAVGVYDGTTLMLYVDGSLVASTSSAHPQNYTGYWRIGYDNLANWPSIPNSYCFEGSIGEVSVWNGTALSATQVSDHYSAAGGGSYDAAVLADSPASYWKLNESVGPVFADATNRGNSGFGEMLNPNGVYTGGVTLNQSGALTSDSAITLDGVGGYVNLPTMTWFNGGDFTIEGWVNPAANQNWQRLVDFSNGSASDNVLIAASQGTTGIPRMDIYHGSTGHEIVAGIGAIALNQWTHVVVTWQASSGTASLYINGSLSATATGWAPTNVVRSNNYIGRSPWSADSYFKGGMDEVAIYAYALSATQVANHYHGSGR